MKEHHNTTSRYVPVTKKDHERGLVDKDHICKKDYCECENEGMDTHTHTSRYVPVNKNQGLFEKVHEHPKDLSLKSNWLGINYHNSQTPTTGEGLPGAGEHATIAFPSSFKKKSGWIW